MPGKESLRDTKKELLRKTLIEISDRLFYKQGFEVTTIDQIAQEAMISRRTFFRYFPTKEAVVFPYQDERIAVFRKALEDELSTHPPLEAIRRASGKMAKLLMDARKEQLRQYRIVKRSPYLQSRQLEYDVQWEATISEALAKYAGGGKKARYNQRIIAGAVFGLIRATYMEWMANGAKGDLVAFGETALKILDNGIGQLNPSTFSGKI